MKKAVLIALAFLVCFAIFMHAIGQGAALKDTSLTGKDGVGAQVVAFFASIGSKGKSFVSSISSFFASVNLSFDSTSTEYNQYVLFDLSIPVTNNRVILIFGYDSDFFVPNNAFGDIYGVHLLYCSLPEVNSMRFQGGIYLYEFLDSSGNFVFGAGRLNLGLRSKLLFGDYSIITRSQFESYLN